MPHEKASQKTNSHSITNSITSALRQHNRNGGNGINTPKILSEVYLLRKELGLSQDKFAKRFGIPVGTIRNWEQTNAKPDSAAQIIINMIKVDPDAVADLVDKAKNVEIN